ncbi:MAG: galactokinase [Clostridiaceae bacterium]|nr:galactokinase [Clostridiaceae bacterium]
MQLEKITKRFIELYGGNSKDIRFFSAPGRVNLIGEHTDYNGGYVFPAALTMHTLIAARKTGGNTINIAATDLPDRVCLDINNLDSYRQLKWGNYQAGVAYIMQQEGFEITGCDMLYHGDIPYGAGLSSSASIEVATAFALATFSREAKEDNSLIELVELAEIGQRAENEYAGVNCGIMDQFSSALGKKDNAIFLDCKDLSYSYVPLRLKDKKIIIANTNKKRSLQTSKYNERKAECDAALGQFKMVLPEKEFLGTVTVEEYLQYKKLLIIDETIRKRAKHVIFECDRVLKSVNALEKGDINTFGELMIQSHYSLRELYEVTGVELDTLVEEALKIKGVIGSRMTGAGFGGCTVSIVEDGAVDRFINTVGKAYANKIGYDATFYISDIGDGVREIYI